MTISFAPICMNCARLKVFPFCEAFAPEQIPMEIVLNVADHTKPYPGDHGMQFQTVDERVAEAVLTNIKEE